MTYCAHCNEPATANIPENPGRVCVTHAIDYWTAMLASVKDIRVKGAMIEAPGSAASRAVMAQ